MTLRCEVCGSPDYFAIRVCRAPQRLAAGDATTFPISAGTPDRVWCERCWLSVHGEREAA